MRKAVIVRGFNGASGYIGAVRVSIPSNPPDLVKLHGENHVLVVTVDETPSNGQVIVTPVGMENYHFQVNQADVVDMEEEVVAALVVFHPSGHINTSASITDQIRQIVFFGHDAGDFLPGGEAITQVG